MQTLSRKFKNISNRWLWFYCGNLIKRLNQFEVDSIFNLDNLTHVALYL